MLCPATAKIIQQKAEVRQPTLTLQTYQIIIKTPKIIQLIKNACTNQPSKMLVQLDYIFLTFLNYNWKLLTKIFLVIILPRSFPSYTRTSNHVEKIPNDSRLKMNFFGVEPYGLNCMIAHLLQWPGMHMKPCLGKTDEDVKNTKSSLMGRIPT